MTVGSLFAGVGGLDLGLERAGMCVLWQVEIDPFCQRVLEKHWPGVPRYGDIHDCGAHNLKPVDLICGGFPCQPTSLIGKRKGEADARWLWPEFARVLRELRPRYVLVENPTGINVRGLGQILGDLASLGYDAEWDVLPAGAFGARHRRDRTFLVAYAHSNRLEARDGAATADRQPLFRAETFPQSPVRWNITEPCVLSSVDGVPDRVARCRAAGNAVVPQVAEWLGRRILEADRALTGGGE